MHLHELLNSKLQQLKTEQKKNQENPRYAHKYRSKSGVARDTLFVSRGLGRWVHFSITVTVNLKLVLALIPQPSYYKCSYKQALSDYYMITPSQR